MPFFGVIFRGENLMTRSITVSRKLGIPVLLLLLLIGGANLALANHD